MNRSSVKFLTFDAAVTLVIAGGLTQGCKQNKPEAKAEPSTAQSGNPTATNSSTLSEPPAPMPLSESGCSAMRTVDPASKAAHQQNYLDLHARLEQNLDHAIEVAKEVPELSARLSADNGEMDNIGSSKESTEDKRQQALRFALDAKSIIARTKVTAQQATVLIDDALRILYDADREGCIIGVPYGSTDNMKSALLSSRNQVQDALRSAESSGPSMDELIKTASR